MASGVSDFHAALHRSTSASWRRCRRWITVKWILIRCIIYYIADFFFQTLYTYPENFRAYKALIAAQFSGAQVKIAEDFVFGETNKTEPFLKKFPLGKVSQMVSISLLGKICNTVDDMLFLLLRMMKEVTKYSFILWVAKLHYLNNARLLSMCIVFTIIILKVLYTNIWRFIWYHIDKIFQLTIHV